ncbi:MAG: UbiA family prenyltransferase [Candidatus Bathyarchaeota archaeon]|nr:UbiA family prenyltransferase [Candidatus Bathyarchaeota archaeon]
MSKIKEITVLINSRAEAIFLWSWITGISCLVVGRGLPAIYPTVLAIVSSAMIAASVYFYNDVIDREMDSSNPIKVNKPLVNGDCSPETAYQMITVTGVLGLAIAATVNSAMLISSTAFFVVFFVYSMPQIRLKRMFLVKELVIASGFMFSSVIGSTAIINGLYTPSIFMGLVSAVFGFLVTPAINDSFDVEEDKQFNIKSLATVLSWQNRVIMLGMAVTFISVMSIVGNLRFGFGDIFPVSIILASLLVLRYLPPIYRNFEITSVLKTRKIFKGYYFFINIMFIVGSLNLPFNIF